MSKEVDDRIRKLIENGVKKRNRSIFVIVGDKYQIANLHCMLSEAVNKSRPTVLWCFKEKLKLSSIVYSEIERRMQVKKLQRGLLDPEKVDAFSLFLESGAISYCLYGESGTILGKTYGMCILQDFEALTPNILARTNETVEGGGLVVLLLRSLSSPRSLCTTVMDVHESYRT